jgi:hypothetical protein
MVLTHSLSSALGLYALFFFFKSLVVDILILMAVAYIVLATLHSLDLSRGPAVSLLSFTYLIGK